MFSGQRMVSVQRKWETELKVVIVVVSFPIAQGTMPGWPSREDSGERNGKRNGEEMCCSVSGTVLALLWIQPNALEQHGGKHGWMDSLKRAIHTAEFYYRSHLSVQTADQGWVQHIQLQWSDYLTWPLESTAVEREFSMPCLKHGCYRWCEFSSVQNRMDHKHSLSGINTVITTRNCWV